jgi:transcriptional regulator GlxA family with amidase domain
LFLQDGNVRTSAGATVGIDITLALIPEVRSAALAAQVARRLVAYLRRPGGQKQYSEPLSLHEMAGIALCRTASGDARRAGVRV